MTSVTLPLHLLITLLVFQVGCSHTPNPDLLAKEWGYQKKTVKGILFQHTLFINKVIKIGKDTGNSIHIYLEGDGRPWRTPTHIALDPTPRNPLMLKLMALDNNQAIYLGRPCYFELSPACSPIWWTFKRYSEEVLDSMAAVVERYTRDYDSIVLMGHSGGGALAMLLAERLPKTSAIITLAGNLDIEAWTKHHRYTQLTGSLNPASQPPLSKTIRQYHYLG
ncbi:MAG: lipase family protein, partial [Gammaproteobacteria bacterium]|nr:lipase family protein [Gammaproteobacteria bacterium]